MIILIFLIIIIVVIGFVSYYYFKFVVNEIYEELFVLDKIFEQRFTELTKDVAQFQKYMYEQKYALEDLKRAKSEVAGVLKPKNAQELAQKLINENALSLNINLLIEKCDLSNAHPDLRECIMKQTDFWEQIKQSAQKYNNTITLYKKIKNIFPFSLYSKQMGIDLDLDLIKTE